MNCLAEEASSVKSGVGKGVQLNLPDAHGPDLILAFLQD
jgi:hypothetical protein